MTTVDKDWDYVPHDHLSSEINSVDRSKTTKASEVKRNNACPFKTLSLYYFPF
jgi:hypothetical protein